MSFPNTFPTFARELLAARASLTVGGHEKLPGDGHEAARWRS